MDHPGQWHYVATRLMAHMGAYSPDEMNTLHWQWHQRAALRIHAAMQRQNMWDIPGSLGYEGHASGHRRPRSQDILEPPRQTAPRNSPDCNRRHHSEWVPPLARIGPPSDRSPRRGAQAVPTPHGCKAARRSSARRQGTLAAPAVAAARRLPRHGESCSTRIRTEAMEVPTTSTLNRRHLLPLPDAGPRGPAPNGCTSPPFSRQPSASDRQRFTRSPAGQQMERPAHPPPPSQSRRPARCRGTARHGHTAKGTCGRPKAGARGRGRTPPPPPPRERGAMTAVPDTGTGSRPTRPVQHGVHQPSCNTAKTARARRTHRNNRSPT